MIYLSSISDFFKSPKWGMNLLFGAVCILIPAVGPIVLQGWHITGFWARREEKDPAKFPDFDFQYFGKYLGRGIWPFLVSLVATFVFMIVVMILIAVPLALSGMLFSHADGNGASVFPAVILISMLVIYPVVLLLFYGIMTPLMVRATITQDFARSFDASFMKSFLALMWKDIILTTLFMMGVGIVCTILAVVTCYIGGLLAFPVLLYSWHHLQKQLYQLYLGRGGEAIPASPSLADLPPAFPL